MAYASRALLPVLAAITLASWVSVAATTKVHVVLPNPKLLGCESVTCSQLWLNDNAAPDAKYPKQLRIDFSDGSTITTHSSLFGFPNGVPYGLTAVYDKSVSIEDVEASINERYSKWVYGDPTPGFGLWRIEPEKFVIQLSSHEDGPQVIYLPIVTKSLLRQRPQ